MSPRQFTLPRPGQTLDPTPPPIPGPSESSFTATFGQLLPPASYLTTPQGRAAYYTIRPDIDQIITPDQPHRVLLIHGVQTPAIGLIPLLRALRSSFPYAHFALVDLWGHGLSDTPLVAHDAELFLSLIDGVLDELSWEKVHVIGYSFGGSLTAGFAATRPERVASLVFVAPAGLMRRVDLSVGDREVLDGGDEEAARRWARRWLEGGDLVVPGDWKERWRKGEIVAEAVREWSGREHKGHTGSVLGVLKDGGVFDNQAAFKKVGRMVKEGKVSTISILGETDDVCDGKDLREVGLGDVIVIEGVGHGVVRQSASEVAEVIGRFWREHGL